VTSFNLFQKELIDLEADKRGELCVIVDEGGPSSLPRRYLPGARFARKPTRFASLLFALRLGLGLGLCLGSGLLGLGLGLEANRVGLQECGQIGPGANSTPGK
jgi:hypothetical protein